MKSMTGIFLLLPLFLVSASGTDAQQNATQERQEIDGIAAIVGEEIILNSEVYLQYQLELQGRGVSENTLSDEERTQFLSAILDQLIDRAVIVEQARIDSIIVSRSEVEAAIDEWIIQVKANMGGGRQTFCSSFRQKESPNWNSGIEDGRWLRRTSCRPACCSSLTGDRGRSREGRRKNSFWR
ncbi:SurA N-terminal domain-containing protein [Gemmatimonadota bacterium]